MQYFKMLLGTDAAASDSGFLYRGPESLRADFLKHYDHRLRPLLEQFESSRCEQLASYRLRSRVFVVAVLAVALVFVLLWQRDTMMQYLQIASVGAVALLSMIYYWSQAPVRAFKASIKAVVFPRVLEFYGEQFQFSERPNWSLASLASFMILPAYDRARSEDHIVGSYKDVDFQMMEVELIQRQRNGRESSSETTVFRGVAVLLQLHKNMTGKTIVKRDSGVFGNWLNSRFRGLQRVRLEDPEFERRFEVYADDQIEARYLLSPTFMERLLKLERVFAGDALQCSFHAQSLLLLIASKKNRFEPGSIYEPVTFSSEIATVMNELQELFGIVDGLKLDQRTGL